MRIAKVSGDNIQIRDHTFFFPNTSFAKEGPTDDFLSSNGYLKVFDGRSYDSNTQKMVSSAPYVEAGAVYTVRVEDLSSDELSAITDNKATEARQIRDSLLQQTDWTKVSDSPMSSNTWYTAYRQELRDLPEQSGWPTNITWPIHPTANTGS